MTTCCRCIFLARSYATSTQKQYAEALALGQRARLHLRESSVSLSSITATNSLVKTYVPTRAQILQLETLLDKDEARYKSEWFNLNGGGMSSEKESLSTKPSNKPIFFDIALNYVQLDMDRLQERAGMTSALAPSLPMSARTTTKDKAAVPLPVGKAKKEEVVERAATPEPSEAPRTGGGLSSLLGGWWGRR